MTTISSLRRGSALAAALAGIAAAAACAPAWAMLGESGASVDTDVQAMHGALASTQVAAQNMSITVKTLSLPSGTSVKEYIASSGKVVAVSWRGPRPPNLTQLLGSYYADYQTALAARQPGQHNRHLLLNSGRMVFESGGHMRDLHGSAYLPALLPQGVSAGDLN